jgi:hypothetical protein
MKTDEELRAALREPHDEARARDNWKAIQSRRPDARRRGTPSVPWSFSPRLALGAGTFAIAALVLFFAVRGSPGPLRREGGRHRRRHAHARTARVGRAHARRRVGRLARRDRAARGARERGRSRALLAPRRNRELRRGARRPAALGDRERPRDGRGARHELPRHAPRARGRGLRLARQRARARSDQRRMACSGCTQATRSSSLSTRPTSRLPKPRPRVRTRARSTPTRRSARHLPRPSAVRSQRRPRARSTRRPPSRARHPEPPQPPEPTPAPAIPTAQDRLRDADRLRAAGQLEDAAQLLSSIVEDPSAGSERALAAFTLGRLELDRRARPREAADAFGRAIDLGLRAPLLEDARARRVQALARVDREAARRAADDLPRTSPRGALAHRDRGVDRRPVIVPIEGVPIARAASIARAPGARAPLARAVVHGAARTPSRRSWSRRSW